MRELNRIAFPGAPYQHVFFVADTVVTGRMVADELNVYLWRDGFHLFFPMRGKDHWRVVGILPHELRDKADLTFDDVIPSLRGEAGMASRSRSATGSRPTASSTAAPSTSATGAASCSATRRTSTAPSARRA